MNGEGGSVAYKYRLSLGRQHHTTQHNHVFARVHALGKWDDIRVGRFFWSATKRGDNSSLKLVRERIYGAGAW
jgi:hypothetical protein